MIATPAAVVALYGSLALSGWLLARLMTRGRGAVTAVGALVLASVLAIVLSEGLSVAKLWTTPALAVCSVVTAVIVAIAYVRLCRSVRPERIPQPGVPAPRTTAERLVTTFLRAIAVLVAAATAASLAIEFWIGMRIAPNNWDSMTYHLSRIGYWMQYQRIGDYPGATVRQLGSLPNGEILQALFMLPLKSDKYAFAAQWIALIGLGLAVYVGARLVTRNRPAAIIAGCAFMLLPQPVLQSTTTQNDLICAFFVLAGTVFALRGLLRSYNGELVIGALAIAVAIGTKGTAWFAVPGLVLAGAYLYERQSVSLSRLASLVGLTAMAALVVDGYWFVSNLTHGRPLDGGVAGQTSTLSGAYGAHPDLANIKADLLRTVDITGLPPYPRDTLIRLVDHIAPAQASMNIISYPQEDLTAFGIAGLLVIPVVMVWGLVARRVGPSSRVFAIMSLASLITFALIVAANPWTARLMIYIVALAAPLLALAFRRWWLVLPVLVIMMVPGYRALTHNANKELLHPGGTLPLQLAPRIIQVTQQRPELTGPLLALDSYAPSGSHIGYVGGEDDWDYPVFGSDFGRRVTRISPEDATATRLNSPDLDGTFWALEGTAPPRGSHAIPLGGKYYWIPN